MAIKPKCDKCKNELMEFGAVLLSPPNKRGMVKKFHLCLSCYKGMAFSLKSQKVRNN